MFCYVTQKGGRAEALPPCEYAYANMFTAQTNSPMKRAKRISRPMV